MRTPVFTQLKLYFDIEDLIYFLNSYMWRIKFTNETCKKNHINILIMKTTFLDTHGSSSDCSNLGDFSPQGTERTTFTFYKSLKRKRGFVYVSVCAYMCMYEWERECVCMCERRRERQGERKRKKNHENPILCPICLKKCGMREGRD